MFLSLFAIVRGKREEHTDTNTIMRRGREILVLGIGDMAGVG
jgi:hypothetical protein